MGTLIGIAQLEHMAVSLPSWGGLHLVFREGDSDSGYPVWWFDSHTSESPETLLGHVVELRGFVESIKRRFGVNGDVVAFLRFLNSPKHGPNWVLQCGPQFGEIISRVSLREFLDLSRTWGKQP